MGQQLQTQIRGFDTIDLLGSQHPFLVKPGCRSREGERYHQAKQREYRALDRAKTAPLAFRLFRTAPDTKAPSDFQQKEHANEKKQTKKKRRNGRFHAKRSLQIYFGIQTKLVNRL